MFKKKRYKTNLNKIQMNTIYLITSNKEKQSKLMSILQYCLKYTDKSTGILNKTISRLFDMYSVNNFQYHNRISRKYFYMLINLLIEYKLICVHKIVHKKVHKNNVPESTEATKVEVVFEKTNDITINNTYTYTLYTESSSVHALDLCEDIFKDLKVNSKIIKCIVLSKLKNTVLDAAGAVNYIVKVITEKTEEYNRMRVKYAQKVAETKYNKNKNTFVVPVKASTRTFYNVESREYDYDMLEDKLVYGGYNGEALLIRK